ncbi:MAG TPA: type II secretion system protein [Patescibacteria group bacterium]|nr:type II secretion system protein [Patescibacteria group bacterium]
MQKKTPKVYSEHTGGEHCQTKRRAFSLVELLVVIGIVGILATVGIISYNGTQKVARDNQRKSDLQAIGTAYKMHYADKKTWKFSNAELQIVVPGITSVGEGSDGQGQGFFNYQGANQASMANALTVTGYLSKAPRDPLVSSDTLGMVYDASLPHQYMKFFCLDSGGVSLGGIVIFAKLEKPNPSDIDSSVTECFDRGSSLYNGLNSTFGMNYAIRVK